MKSTDVKLIQRVLDGDDTAFSDLVKKYQKSVHALVWRKIGDFHIAEELTQDTFIKAYKKLETLRKPQCFASWLYVIATRRCIAWHRKKRLRTQSLEDTSSAELEKATYSDYVITENERTVAKAQREVVKKLLAKLQESDRTVITLYYLGGMTYEEISRFLGVSVSSIKNRLYRARQHLKKEEPMIREALEHFQITPNLTDNIMQEIARLKPTAPTGGKPLVPWGIAAASAVLIVLLLGLGSQYLVHFQKPYSLDAQAEMKVELVDAPIVLNLDTKPDVSRQLGNINAIGENESNGQKPDDILLASAQVDGEDVSVPKQQWIQSEPLIGSMIEGLFGNEQGEVYTVHKEHIYKWQDDRTGWQQVGGDIRDYHDQLTDIDGLSIVPMADLDNTLYMVLDNLFLASKDGGKTWKLVHSWTGSPGVPRELVLTEQTFWATFHRRAFRSEDKGKTWKDVTEEFPGSMFFGAIQNTVFAGTYTGLYHWKTDKWVRIELPVLEAIVVSSGAATKDRLYVMASLGPDLDYKAAEEGRQRTWWIFRSTDMGNSWKDITPTNAWPLNGLPPDIQLVAAGQTLLLMGRGMVRSEDGGDTWMPRQDPSTLPMKMISFLRPATLNERVFFVNALEGLYRSTDGGKSWQKVKITQDKNRLRLHNLVAYKGSEKMTNMQATLYGLAARRGIAKTTDKGKSWKTIQVEISMTTPLRKEPPRINRVTTSDGIIYAKGQSHYPIGELHHYRVSEDENRLLPIQGMPTFDSRELKDHLRKAQNLSIETLQEGFSGATIFFKELIEATPRQQETFIRNGLDGKFAVSGDTFYMEYNFKLFRWEPGDIEWQDIGQEETSEIRRNNLKMSVSGDTVYVGKRDGHLVVSFDKGNNWIDLTPALPFPVRTFKEIVVAGTTVYVATDVGILISEDGRNWHVVADADGTNLIMEHLAIDGTTLYGITQKTGIYRLVGDTGTWEQIVTEIPHQVTSLAVDGDTLYVGTENLGMFHFNLEN